MQPRPWRETVRPWVPSAMVSIAAELLSGARTPPAAGGVHWLAVGLHPTGAPVAPDASARARVGGDDLGADEDGATPVRRHDAVEFGPVLMGPSSGLEDGPDGGRHVEAELRPVVGPDEAHGARDGDPVA